jgi:hypothetical protein
MTAVLARLTRRLRLHERSQPEAYRLHGFSYRSRVGVVQDIDSCRHESAKGSAPDASHDDRTHAVRNQEIDRSLAASGVGKVGQAVNACGLAIVDLDDSETGRFAKVA